MLPQEILNLQPLRLLLVASETTYVNKKIRFLMSITIIWGGGGRGKTSLVVDMSDIL